MISAEEKQNLVVGFKQVSKAVRTGACVKIFIAEDCSANIADNLKGLSAGIETVFVPTMRDLGSMCGIDVPASCAAVKRSL